MVLIVAQMVFNIAHSFYKYKVSSEKCLGCSSYAYAELIAVVSWLLELMPVGHQKSNRVPN